METIIKCACMGEICKQEDCKRGCICAHSRPLPGQYEFEYDKIIRLEREAKRRAALEDTDTTGWAERFVKKFYIYNLETKTPAGAEKEAVAFITELLAIQKREIRDAVIKMVPGSPVVPKERVLELLDESSSL